MNVLTTSIPGVILLEPKIFGDERGYFFESFNARTLATILPEGETFVQDNQSKSAAGVLRGLHFQHPPFAQGKLVRVVRGSVLDVVVDIRKDSATYGKYFSAVLSDKNHHAMWIPKGMAHGFLSLEDDTIFTYKCTEYYHPEAEDCLLYSDPSIHIDWNVTDPIVSPKDKLGKAFATFNSPF
jgi:dTDP-4-dehydrorhamnose 3,5-epimerase